MIAAVKAERSDDHEINEMARKILEQNRLKSAQAGHMAPGGYVTMQPQLARPGQPAISNYFANRNGGVQQALPVNKETEEKKLDEESKKGRFGWCEFEKNYIPYIFRNGSDKYTSVRMVERKFLNKFLSVLPPEVNSCHCIRSYYITDYEAKLLNEINLKHADCFFGKEAFTTKDLVVRLKDAKEFYRFLDLCYKKLVLKRSNSSDRCGFFRINGESVVPYTVCKEIKYVPLFYFEGETDHLKLKSDTVEGWDLAYLKFCCKVQGIRNELFASDVCRVVALEEIKGHFPAGTTFEDYWPAKGSIEPVNAQRVSAGNWTQKPTPTTLAPAATAKSSLLPSYNGSTAAAADARARSNYESQLLASQQFQNLIRAGMVNGSLQQFTAAAAMASQQQQQQQAALAAAAAATAARQHQSRSASIYNNSSRGPDESFPGKLTQIKEFPVERSQQLPYKLQKALIDQKIVPCINVRPYVFHDLMMTLPDFVRHFYPDLTIEKARHMLQDILKVVLYKGNSGHQEVLKNEGKCTLCDPVPLVLVKDIMNYMPQMKYMFANIAHNESLAKRMKLG